MPRLQAEDFVGLRDRLVVPACEAEGGRVEGPYARVQGLRGFSEFSRDLSESQESEARYRGLLEAAPDAMVVVNQPGEIVLLDAESRLLFTGDNDNVLVWLFLPTCRPLEVYLESLRKLKRRDGEFDTILPGHGPPLPRGFLADQIACVESILDGSCKGEPYQSFAGNGLLCRRGSAAVAFDPGNLRVRK